MEIQEVQAGDFTELVLQGRLDAHWADHVTRNLEEVIRGGADRIQLNMEGVTYISSIGIRVMLRIYKQLKGIQGVFRVSKASAPVKQILQLTNLGHWLVVTETATAATTVADTGTVREYGPVAFKLFSPEVVTPVSAQVVGNPQSLASEITAGDVRSVRFPADTLAVGLGAFGQTLEECQGRFGEFLSVAGASAYQPTDGTNKADYLVAEGDFVPDVQVVYSLTCKGELGYMARFEARTPELRVGLADLAQAALDITGAATVALVIVAESAGLMGAALRRSPAATRTGSLFAYPEVRNWLSFSSERSFHRSSALVVGMASRSATGTLAPLLRPLMGTGAVGHFHAAAFSYRPLKRGQIPLDATVKSLFDSEDLQGILHLIGDDRKLLGAGQSEFVRGACWFGPVEAQ
jgi:anti-anti-sigma factor